MVVGVFCVSSVIIGSWLSGRCRRRLRVTVMVVSLLRTGGPVVMTHCFSTGWGVVAVPQTRGSTHGGRQRDHPDRAQQHHGAAESRHRFSLQPAVPDPASAHDDINLEQQRAKVRGLDQFRFTGVGTERRASSSRHRPQRNDGKVHHDAKDQHRGGGSCQHQPRPEELEQRDGREKQPCWHPFLPVGGNDREVDDRSAQRGERGEPSR